MDRSRSVLLSEKKGRKKTALIFVMTERACRVRHFINNHVSLSARSRSYSRLSVLQDGKEASPSTRRIILT